MPNLLSSALWHKTGRLLRTKEFLMKDMYSFDASSDAAQVSYAETRSAYAAILNKIFDWGDIPAAPQGPFWREAEADTGVMGVAAEDMHVRIYQDVLDDGSPVAHALVLPTNRNLRAGSISPHTAPFAAERADAELDAGRLQWRVTVDCEYAASTPEQVQNAVRQEAVRLGVSDTTGVSAAPLEYKPLRESTDGDLCAKCDSGTLSEHRAIEIGHTFLLGPKYTGAFGYGVVPAGGTDKIPIEMGCYGIGVTRILGALAQRAYTVFKDIDNNPTAGEKKARIGFAWPAAVAPYEALILPTSPITPDKMRAAEALCTKLDEGTVPGEADSDTHIHIPAGEIILDDRAGQSLGSRLFDADLVGYPYVFVLGKHWQRTGEVEIRQMGQPVRYAVIPGVAL
ncbi:proline--tRNA ligase [Malassezia sp. CBS 17886]|nr:proline--tRNA ligase [Malassezia sp. CBS 17886]